MGRLTRPSLVVLVVGALLPHHAAVGDHLPPVEKVEVGSNRELLVNGRPFFPMMMTLAGHWHEGHADVGRQGFNVIDVYGDPSIARKDLDNAWANNLYGIVVIQELWNDTAKAAALVRDLREHPALLAWELPDEPDVRGITPEQCRALCETIRAEDPNHPVWLNVSEPSTGEPYVDACDIISEDSYPIQETLYDLSLPVRHVETLHGFVKGRKPVWMYVQTYHVEDRGPAPTPEQVRCMVYMAIAHGVTGIPFYSFHESSSTNFGKQGDQIPYPAKGWRLSRDEPALWGSLKTLNDEIRQLAPVILSPNANLKVTAHVLSDLSRSRDQWGFPPIHAIVKNDDGAIYLMAANGFPEAARVRLRVSSPQPFAAAERAEVLFEGRSVGVSGSRGRTIRIEDDFPGWGVHVYRVDRAAP